MPTDVILYYKSTRFTREEIATILACASLDLYRQKHLLGLSEFNANLLKKIEGAM